MFCNRCANSLDLLKSVSLFKIFHFMDFSLLLCAKEKKSHLIEKRFITAFKIKLFCLFSVQFLSKQSFRVFLFARKRARKKNREVLRDIFFVVEKSWRSFPFCEVENKCMQLKLQPFGNQNGNVCFVVVVAFSDFCYACFVLFFHSFSVYASVCVCARAHEHYIIPFFYSLFTVQRLCFALPETWELMLFYVLYRCNWFSTLFVFLMFLCVCVCSSYFLLGGVQCLLHFLLFRLILFFESFAWLSITFFRLRRL